MRRVSQTSQNGSGRNLSATVALLCDRELDTLALGQTDPRLLLADDENVALTGRELVVNSVLDVDDVEASIVALTVSDNTNTTLAPWSVGENRKDSMRYSPCCDHQ